MAESHSIALPTNYLSRNETIFTKTDFSNFES